MTTIFWPNGSSCAVLLNIMLEEWSDESFPKIGPMGNPLADGLTDYQARSWARYGLGAGLQNIASTLRDMECAATFFVSGIFGERRPDRVNELVEDGHEIAAHGWSQDILAPALSPEREAELIGRTRESLMAACGSHPRGWISPRCTPSGDTAQLLAAQGFTWTADVFDADMPYPITTSSGRLIASPFGMDINDLPTTVRYGHSISAVWRSYAHHAEALAGMDRATYIDVTFHSHIGGRLPSIHVLRDVIEDARSRGFWIATRSELIEYCAQTHLTATSQG